MKITSYFRESSFVYLQPHCKTTAERAPKSQVSPGESTGEGILVTYPPTGETTSAPKEGGETDEDKLILEIVVSGTANTIAFNQIFSSFIMLLKENDVNIEFKITAKSNKNYPITENSQQYKIVKESVSQMGFELDEE